MKKIKKSVWQRFRDYCNVPKSCSNLKAFLIIAIALFVIAYLVFSAVYTPISCSRSFNAYADTYVADDVSDDDLVYDFAIPLNTTIVDTSNPDLKTSYSVLLPLYVVISNEAFRVMDYGGNYYNLYGTSSQSFSLRTSCIGSPRPYTFNFTLIDGSWLNPIDAKEISLLLVNASPKYIALTFHYENTNANFGIKIELSSVYTESLSFDYSNGATEETYIFTDFDYVYQQGVSAGANANYQDGYDYGYQQGLSNNTLAQGEYERGKNDGYQQGYQDAERITSLGFSDLLDAVFFAPIKAFFTVTDFDLLGINFGGLCASLIGFALILIIVKFVLGIIF